MEYGCSGPVGAMKARSAGLMVEALAILDARVT